MRKVILSSICLIFILSNNAFAGQVYKGNWSGRGASASFEIRTTVPLKVRYCFKTQCNIYSAKGNSKNFKISFYKVNKEKFATLRIKKNGAIYNGKFVSPAGKYYATFK